MSAQLIVFANEYERGGCCADMCHDWENQPNLFGSETEKLLKICEDLKKVYLYHVYYPGLTLEEMKKHQQTLLKKIYGIAKVHGVYIRWYGQNPPCEPDRFLIAGRGFDRLAFIQC